MLVQFRWQLEPEQEIERLDDDGEACAEQPSPDQGKKRGEPEAVIEQPEGRIALRRGSITGKTDGEQ